MRTTFPKAGPVPRVGMQHRFQRQGKLIPASAEVMGIGTGELDISKSRGSRADALLQNPGTWRDSQGGFEQSGKVGR